MSRRPSQKISDVGAEMVARDSVFATTQIRIPTAPASTTPDAGWITARGRVAGMAGHANAFSGTVAVPPSATGAAVWVYAGWSLGIGVSTCGPTARTPEQRARG